MQAGGQPYYLEYKHVEPYFEIILYFIMGSFVLFIAILTGCCVYDSIAHWRHLAYFHSCLTQVQKVHEIFQKPQGELPLCPICIEKVSTAASSTSVVFLCGHRYHTECANQWYLAKPRKGRRGGRGQRHGGALRRGRAQSRLPRRGQRHGGAL